MDYKDYTKNRALKLLAREELGTMSEPEKIAIAAHVLELYQLSDITGDGYVYVDEHVAPHWRLTDRFWQIFGARHTLATLIEPQNWDGEFNYEDYGEQLNLIVSYVAHGEIVVCDERYIDYITGAEFDEFYGRE